MTAKEGVQRGVMEEREWLRKEKEKMGKYFFVGG